ncbi:ribosome-recycling factor [Geobacter sp. SVR]|nr:ribosome recycling factor [Geobacter sp. SVR]BCS54688.1 ribosome-recycling factor [Geobacter sp. SVR]GCF87628.1 ribosome-recycling factor [Geobacter sp. SVR]
MPRTVLDDMKLHMEKSVAVLKNEFQKIRTGRASTSILDAVKVDYYGNPSSLSQVATLAVPEPRTITIAPWEAKMVPLIEKAILNANIGLTPSSDGRTIRLNLPPLTEERRKEIVKDLKKKAEEDKVALRNIRRDAIDRLKKLEKEKAITEDDLKRLEKEVQDTTKSFETKIDEAVAHKEKEVMEV